MQLQFINWDKPLLHSAAEFILRQPDSVKRDRVDLRNVTLAFSGERARNRFEEILIDCVETFSEDNGLMPDWYPPELITFGSLPDMFYEQKLPIANSLTQQFAWITVIEDMFDGDAETRNDLLSLLPTLPDRDNLQARLALGDMFAKLHRELSSEDLTFDDVAARCKMPEVEAERWNVMSQIQQRYRNKIDSLKVWDIQMARQFAIKHQEDDEFDRIKNRFKRENRRFYLVGLVDMNRLQKDILKKFSEFITPLVFAPETLADCFDDFGCLDANKWNDNYTINFAKSQISVVDDMHGQASVVLLKVAGHNDGSKNQTFSANEIVVAVPNDEAVPFIEQQLENANIRTRLVAGVSMKQNAVYRLLESLADFVGAGTFKSFATFVRHPDIGAFLYDKLPNVVRQTKDGTDAEVTSEFVIDLLTELDTYYTKFLPEKVDGNWHEIVDDEYPQHNNTFAGIKAAWAAINELVACNDVKTFLDRVYAGQSGNVALKKVNEALDELKKVPAVFYSDTKQTFSERIQLILSQLAGETLTSESDDNAVELLGWLEIPMDDAKVVIVTGLNEGVVPSFVTSDIFLPENIRQQLGINDNKRRYVRDCYALTTILATRPSENVHLISCKRSVDGTPLLPSRLLFATDDNKKIAERVQGFFKDMEKEASYQTIQLHFAADGSKDAAGFFGDVDDKKTYRIVNVVNKVQQRSGFTIPDLSRYYKTSKFDSISVTDFAQYKTCPYRGYFLQRVLGLDSLNDNAEEIDAMGFGTLIHAVTEEFGRNENIIDSTDAATIYGFLEDKLETLVKTDFGDKPRATIAIQMEMAKKRLGIFAQEQVKWRRQGYRVEQVEYKIDNVYLDVDGRKIRLKGRIDRIDKHETTGERVVFDYKTGSTEPEEKHRKGKKDNKEWIDFQLPLYHYILQQNGLGDWFKLGYFLISSDLQKIKPSFVDWDIAEIEQAIEEAREIVRKIWNRQFPINPKAKYQEEYEIICPEVLIK
ncbi:MAG: PD-(D/E)XK nuclease family protein [Planctomycetaceae bacterium]|jgi:hypothetical protein|nr:PD-(D/E)XK nuclease family protein [Planctomycetaceae bacterium]